MNYVIQNYFYPSFSLYFSPKIKFLLFLKSLNLVVYLLKNNFFLKYPLIFIHPLWLDFKFFKNFFFSQNLIFFYKHFFVYKYKFFSYFTESCFYSNLSNLFYFFNFNLKKFNSNKLFSLTHHHNNYYFHNYIAPYNFKKTFYNQFVFYLLINNHFLWPSIYNFFTNKKHFFLINNYFLLNFYYNTFFFNIFKY